MITSYEKFKSVSASLFKNQQGSLNEFRNNFAKTLGFSSVKALKDSFKVENTHTDIVDDGEPISVISVIESSSGVVLGVTTFNNTEKGQEAAKNWFRQIISENNYFEQDEMMAFMKNEYFESPDLEVSIRYS